MAFSAEAKDVHSELTKRYEPTSEERNSLLALQQGAFRRQGLRRKKVLLKMYFLPFQHLRDN